MSSSIIVHRQNRCLRAFREAGATAPESARSAGELGLKASFVFRGLVKRGVLVALPDGRHYLDLDQEQSFRHWRRIRFILAVVLVLAGLLILRLL